VLSSGIPFGRQVEVMVFVSFASRIWFHIMTHISKKNICLNYEAIYMVTTKISISRLATSV